MPFRLVGRSNQAQFRRVLVGQKLHPPILRAIEFVDTVEENCRRGARNREPVRCDRVSESAGKLECSGGRLQIPFRTVQRSEEHGSELMHSNSRAARSEEIPTSFNLSED